MISYLYFSKRPINDDKLVNVLPIFLFLAIDYHYAMVIFCFS